MSATEKMSTKEKKLPEEAENLFFDGSSEFELAEKVILPEKRKCPVCRASTTVGLDFCEVCGADIPEE